MLIEKSKKFDDGLTSVLDRIALDSINIALLFDKTNNNGMFYGVRFWVSLGVSGM